MREIRTSGSVGARRGNSPGYLTACRTSGRPRSTRCWRHGCPPNRWRRRRSLPGSPSMRVPNARCRHRDREQRSLLRTPSNIRTRAEHRAARLSAESIGSPPRSLSMGVPDAGTVIASGEASCAVHRIHSVAGALYLVQTPTDTWVREHLNRDAGRRGRRRKGSRSVDKTPRPHRRAASRRRTRSRTTPRYSGPSADRDR